MPKTIVQEISVQDLADANLNAKLRDISCQCFYIRPDEYDLEQYPKDSKIFLLRDKNTGEIAGYNMVAIGEYEDGGVKHRTLKIGPSAVLPDYRGSNFVPQATLKTIFFEYLNSIRGGYELDLMLVAGNPRFNKISRELPQQYPSKSAKEVDRYNKQIQAAASCVYPLHVLQHLADFSYGKTFGTNWVPRAKDDLSSSPPKGEYKGTGTPHLIKVTTRNLLYAAFTTIFRAQFEALHKAMTPVWMLTNIVATWFNAFVEIFKATAATVFRNTRDVEDAVEAIQREAEHIPPSVSARM